MSAPSDPSAPPGNAGPPPTAGGQPPLETQPLPPGAASVSQAPVYARPESSLTPREPVKHHRPWGWIAVCTLLVLVAGGLAVWALGLNSDLSDEKDQTAQAEQQAQQATDEVENLSGQVDDISQSVDQASEDLSQAGQDAQQTLDGLNGKLATAKETISQAIGNAGSDPAATP